MLRELSEDWRGTAFSYEQYLGQAMATARDAWANNTVTELLDSIDSRITSRVLRMALFSAARELVGADAERHPGGRHPAVRHRGAVRLGPGQRGGFPSPQPRPTAAMVTHIPAQDHRTWPTATRSRPARSGRIATPA